MYSITAKVKGINTIEGNYKNKMIAERHKRKLGKKYPGTTFKIKRISKKDKLDNTFNNFMEENYPIACKLDKLGYRIERR